MCTSPYVRYRPKVKISAVPPQYAHLLSDSYDCKYKGYKILGQKKLESYFPNYGAYLAFMDTYCDYINFPCGKCEECKKSYARDWAVRCYHESLCHETACFLTLTIDNLANARFMEEIENSYKKGTNKYCKYCHNGNKYFRYPIDYSLNRPLILNFLKKLRDYLYRTYNISIRYFGVGEYGTTTNRPHYHVLIFGYNFPTIMCNGVQKFRTFKAGKSDKGFDMYISDELCSLWTYGYCYVQDFSVYTSMYVSKYCMKKIRFIDSENLYDYYYGREPEFLFMSRGSCNVKRCKFIDEMIKDRNLNDLKNLNNKYCKHCNMSRGGIGFQWLVDNFYDLKRLKFIRIDGKKFPIPKYYKKLINLTDENFYNLICSEIIYYVNSKKEEHPEEFSIERLKKRQEINKAKNKLYNSRSSI